MTNFGSTKTELNLKYRLGLEHAFAKADFLNVADLTLVQAFAIFICLARRHDSPRFVWMMTGLVIRMGQALGLHRDGTNFKHLTPFEAEMRRRAWWVLCMLDVRASEDQGSDYTIPFRSFDTKLPMNINDADIEPTTTQRPTEREGITDMTYALISFQMCEGAKEMMSKGAQNGGPDTEEQIRLLSETYERLNQGYLQHSTRSGDVVYWVAVTIARLMRAKMTLLIYLPVLFSSSNEHFSEDIRSKLLVAAIENAEYNHALNEEQACRHWRWVYQTYTHWHAVVFMLLEISRRPWSPIVERAWVAIHSPWLIPAQSHMDKNLRFWVPLRKLRAKARQHREAELERLKSDPQAAEWLQSHDQMMVVPTSPGPFPAGTDPIVIFCERWRQLAGLPPVPSRNEQAPSQSTPGIVKEPSLGTYPTSSGTSPGIATRADDLRNHLMNDTAKPGANELQTGHYPPSQNSRSLGPFANNDDMGNFNTTASAGPPYTAGLAEQTTWALDPSSFPWPLPAADPSLDSFSNMDFDGIDINMDLNGEVDWYNWVESAKGMDWTNQGNQGQA